VEEITVVTAALVVDVLGIDDKEYIFVDICVLID